jgi:single-strand DNA-binding protein
MAGSLNKVFLIGRLGNDPEIKQMSNGKNVARLSLATSDTWKDKNTGEKKEKTEWHRIVIFNEGLVNVVQQYLKKGAQVYIEGQIQTTKYTDNSGQEKYSTQIVLQGYNSTLTMLGAGSSSSSKIEDNSMSQDNSSLPSDNNISSNDLDDEVPF